MLTQALLWAAGGSGFTFLMTALGAATVFLFRRTASAGLHRIMLGFAAGVMIAASMWSLLIPAIEEAEAMGMVGWVPAAGGSVLGIAFLLAMDALLPQLTPESFRHLGRRTPLLVLAVTLHNIPEGMVSQITVNNYEGTRMATRYLISLGHRELMFLGGRDFSVTHRRRHQGFLDAAAAAANVCYDIFTILSGSKIEDGYRTGLAYFTHCIENKQPIATGILCISDHFALGVMQAAVETGVDIPGQVSLIGFDDVSFASLPKIQLTTISQPKEEICDAAVRTLEELIHAAEPAPVSCKTIQPVLVRRDTCGPPGR